MNIIESMKKRRSHYDLSNKSSISTERLQEILTDAISYSPSAFNSQSSRVVLLLNEKHTKLWEIVTETLRKKVPAEKFGPTAKKMEGFSSAYGTILFFEDMETVENLQKAFPGYSENFPVWSNQSGGMLQFAVWTALAEEGMGASLQHYNPIIDAQVKEEFQVPENWKLLAQMPFGTPNSEAGKKEIKPIETRFKILGGNKND